MTRRASGPERRVAWPWLLGLVLVSACTAKVREVSATEVLLHLSASDEVQARTTGVRIRVAVQQDGKSAWADRPELTLPKPGSALGFPLDVPIVPRNPDDPPKLFQVVAEAIDENGQVLVQERAITSFVTRAQLVLEMVLQACGDRALGTLCETDARCHGTGCLSCVSGACSTTAITATDALAPVAKLKGSAAGGRGGATDAGSDAARGGGGGRQGSDASMGGRDAGANPGGDAGGRDAGADSSIADGSAGDAGNGLPGLATQGAACAHEGDHACQGHDSLQPLNCNAGKWEPNGLCSGDTRCDTQPGPTLGTCQSIPTGCVGKSPGDVVCDGTARTRCDADLLRLEAFDCQANAHCDATSASCACDYGYLDDGSGACAPEYCVLMACQHGGVCAPSASGRSCDCSAIDYDGSSCETKIDDCAGNACGAGATGCTDGVRTRTCTCGAGYTGSGTPSCRDIDECASGAVATCGTGATGCTNTSGSYACACGTGYAGSGTTSCSELNACAVGTPVCTADYPCVDLPAPSPDYTCRGQFPDWRLTGGSLTESGGVVTDSKTGLQWQQNLPATYAGCGGNRSVLGDTCNWAEAQAYCAQLSLAGSGWRLPTKAELESIINYNRTNPAINTGSFPSTPSEHFWTASPYLGGTSTVWVVAFLYGQSFDDSPDTVNRVRCVR